MKTTGKSAPSAGDQEFDRLTKRYEALNTRKIQAETSLQHARQQLDALKQEAREKYGTDDVAELKQKLVAMQTENEAKRQAYKAELDRIETDLKAVEDRFAAAEGSVGGEK